MRKKQSSKKFWEQIHIIVIVILFLFCIILAAICYQRYVNNRNLPPPAELSYRITHPKIFQNSAAAKLPKKPARSDLKIERDYLKTASKPRQYLPQQTLDNNDFDNEVDPPDISERQCLTPLNYSLLIEIRKSSHRLSVRYRGKIQAVCLVTTGKDKDENATPSGIYRVDFIEYNPPWNPPERVCQEEGLPSQIKPYTNYLPARTKDEGNPNALGKVWIGLTWIGNWSQDDPGWPETGLGAHGTNEPDKIGGAWGHGCIRMINKDALNLASWIERVGKENAVFVVKSF